MCFSVQFRLFFRETCRKNSRVFFVPRFPSVNKWEGNRHARNWNRSLSGKKPSAIAIKRSRLEKVTYWINASFWWESFEILSRTITGCLLSSNVNSATRDLAVLYFIYFWRYLGCFFGDNCHKMSLHTFDGDFEKSVKTKCHFCLVIPDKCFIRTVLPMPYFPVTTTCLLFFKAPMISDISFSRPQKYIIYNKLKN